MKNPTYDRRSFEPENMALGAPQILTAAAFLNHAFGAAVNGKIYVIGGRTGHGFIMSATNTDSVEEYDPATNLWSVPKERMPTPRSGGDWGLAVSVPMPCSSPRREGQGQPYTLKTFGHPVSAFFRTQIDFWTTFRAWPHGPPEYGGSQAERGAYKRKRPANARRGGSSSDRTRTCDPGLMNPLLCQLSYAASRLGRYQS